MRHRCSSSNARLIEAPGAGRAGREGRAGRAGGGPPESAAWLSSWPQSRRRAHEAEAGRALSRLRITRASPQTVHELPLRQLLYLHFKGGNEEQLGKVVEYLVCNRLRIC